MSQAETPKDILYEIIKEKASLIPGILKETDIDCWMIFVRETASNPDPVMNITLGGDVVWASAFIYGFLAGEFKKIAIVGNFDAPAEEKKGIWDVVIPYREGITQILQEQVKKLNPTKIALNFSEDYVVADGLSHGLFLMLNTILPDYSDRFVSSYSIINALRGRKSSLEVKLIRKACEITEQINQSISTKLRLGMSEIEIQNLFYKEMNKYDVLTAWQKESCPAIDAGPDKEFGHVGPLEGSVIKSGHTLHNDFGVRYHGYCSDLQRMWFFGKESNIPNELTHAFESVKQAIRKAAEFIKPGVTGISVDKIARDYVIGRGYEEYAHALGHQVGTEAHDGGILLGPQWERYGTSVEGKVEEGNIFTLELGVKTKNFGMVSLEENILVTREGCQFLIPPQEHFICII